MYSNLSDFHIFDWQEKQDQEKSQAKSRRERMNETVGEETMETTEINACTDQNQEIKLN